MSLLSGHNIDYRIDTIRILEDIDIEVEAGELVGLIGPNGAGKSSLLRLLTGVEACSAGEVRVDDKPLALMPATQRARRMGYLVQGAMAYWPFSVEKVIELGRIPYQKWWQQPSVEDLQKVEAAMTKTETLAFRNRIVTTLSGGEQTLVMLARILRNHAAENRAAIVVLHDLSLAARFCDRLYLLNHGKLDCCGSVSEVLTRENIARVYGVDSHIECGEKGVSVTSLSRVSEHHP
jgi:iron complex transport system ATP-binding protein